ncbi:MAG: hypothetical protein IJT41_13235 [Clostridia bacterium]|nr:hypothetical protein [Clostridia bacterium]
MKNIQIREAAAAAGVKHWQIAEALGIADGTFSRKLRHEFDEAETEKVLSIIRKIAEQNT